ncbi:MAG TPA: hypothetical protein VGC08_11745 [Pedobacter sp.]
MQHHEGDNIGSIAKFEIIYNSWVSSLGPVTLNPGRAWLAVPFKEQTGQMKVDTEDNVNGTVYNYSGSIYLHNMRDEVDQAMNPFLGQVSMIRVTDMNGRIYIIGAPDFPVTVTSSGDTGKTYVSENGKEYQFKIEQTFEATQA